MWIEQKTLYWPSEKEAKGKVMVSTVNQRQISRYYNAQDAIDAHLVDLFGEEEAKADPMPQPVAREYVRLMRAASVWCAVVGIWERKGEKWAEVAVPASPLALDEELPAMLMIACRNAVDALNPGLFTAAPADDDAEKNDEPAS